PGPAGRAVLSTIVSPVNPRVVISCSSWLSVCQDWTSLDSGTFSGSQKLPVRRCQTSTSFSSSTRFQLIADTRLARGSFSETVILLPSQGSWSMFGVLRARARSEEHTSELQSRFDLVC